MTTATATAVEALVEHCRQAWSSVLSRAVGAPCEVQVVPETGALPDSIPVCVLMNAEGAISGQAALVMDSRNAGMLAGKIAGNANNTQPVQELIRQAIALGINEFQKQFGATRVQLAAGSPNWQPQTVLAMLAGKSGAEPLRCYLLLSPQICDPNSQAAPDMQVMPPANAPATRETQNRNLSLLMGVELEVTLRFGQRKLPLKQLVELGAGSVVELDKRVQEPVELLLRDKVVARGEVVIVEGQYGLRITDVFDVPQLQ